MKQLKIILAVAGISIPLIAITCVMIMRARLNNEQSELQTSFEERLNEIESSEDEIEYVEVEPYLYNTVDCNKSNLLQVIKYSNVSDSLANVLATAFATVNTSNLPWQVVYNYGYCAVFTLQYDGDVEPVTATCYTQDHIVVQTGNTYYYVHEDTIVNVPDHMVESLVYLLNKNDTWRWNKSEAALVLGKVGSEFPDDEIGVRDNYITLSSGTEIRFSSGVLYYPTTDGYTGNLYAMYTHLQANSLSHIAMNRSDWAPAESLNIVSVIEVLEELAIDFSEDVLVELFSYELPPMYESWTYERDGEELVFYTVEYDANYADNTKSFWLFTLDLGTGSYRKGY